MTANGDHQSEPVFVRLHLSTHPGGGGVAFVSIMQRKTNALGGRRSVVVTSTYESVYGGDPDWLADAERSAVDTSEVLGVELVRVDEREAHNASQAAGS